ncbi:hypothetical protein G4177_06175 [Corallococcus sp. ZKHCc1 1396]|uniref:Uncharacterized protein n=1 Tax=Corallococcus soli TaxID=2710757 RepID=A0ABR9PIM7_9BACT|nr:hypothetical protein [Corallococcus soli]MBE4747765.1 hypothetical protein [Corallococcus soli]
MTDERQQQRVERILLGGRRHSFGLARALLTIAEAAREQSAQAEPSGEPLRISNDQLPALHFDVAGIRNAANSRHIGLGLPMIAPTIVTEEPSPNRHERRKAAARRRG